MARDQDERTDVSQPTQSGVWSGPDPIEVVHFDDDTWRIQPYHDYLRRQKRPGFRVHHCVTPEDFNNYLDNSPTVHCFLLDSKFDDPAQPVDKNDTGLELLRSIRANPRYVTTPVIVFSIVSDPDLPRRYEQAGATMFIAKPIRLSRLAYVIQQEVRNAQEMARTETRPDLQD